MHNALLGLSLRLEVGILSNVKDVMLALGVDR